MQAGSALATLCACAATAGLAVATPAVNASVNACLVPAYDMEDVTAVLSDEGWAPIPTGEPAAVVIEQLIWPQTVYYFTSDTGGQALNSVLDLQRKTVRGFVRKKDIPQSKTRILTRQVAGELETVVVSWRQAVPRTIQISCRFAVSAATLPGSTQAEFEPQPQTDLSDGAITRLVDTVLLNQSGLSLQSGTPVTVSATIETFLSFPSKE